MKKVIRAKLLDGSPVEFNHDEVTILGECAPDEVTYIKYRGDSYPVKSESIEIVQEDQVEKR